MATMQEIARHAGVSRGTVDRVLNKRGGVGPETTEKILRIAEELRYSPNKAARYLSNGKRDILLTFVLFDPEKAAYYQVVRKSIETTAEYLRNEGVRICQRCFSAWTKDEILKCLNDAVKDDSDGIVLCGTNDPELVSRVREITASGVPVVTVGSEMPECGQLGFVGSNAFEAGRTAAGIIHIIQREEIRLGVLLGCRSRMFHNGRLAGLTAGLNEYSHPWSMSFMESDDEDDFGSFDIMKEQLLRHPEVNTLFLSTGNVFGACRALERLKPAEPPKVVCYDNTAWIRSMLQKGVLAASIGTEPFDQGRRALEMLYEYLAFGTTPETTRIYMPNRIFLAENMNL